MTMYLDEPRPTTTPLRTIAISFSAALGAFRARRAKKHRERIMLDTITRLREASPHLLDDIGLDNINPY
jgi:uncharacterized protein YjiS (DUF1127 family)